MFGEDVIRPVVDAVNAWLASPTLISTQMTVYQFAVQFWLPVLLTVMIVMAVVRRHSPRQSHR